jgi:hypothetical protein
VQANISPEVVFKNNSPRPPEGFVVTNGSFALFVTPDKPVNALPSIAGNAPVRFAAGKPVNALPSSAGNAPVRFAAGKPVNPLPLNAGNAPVNFDAIYAQASARAEAATAPIQ